MSVATEAARRLLEIHAVKISVQAPFTWASGLLSPIYCDNRIALSHPRARNFLRDALVTVSADCGDFNVVAGVATAGIPHGVLLADRLERPFVYVRSSAKDHGRRNLIEGELGKDARVLVVEDLISTGGSCLKAVEALRDAGATVVGVLAIFQYGFPEAAAAFEAAETPFRTLSDYNTLIEEAVAMGYIPEQDLGALRAWRENPSKWGALYA